MFERVKQQFCGLCCHRNMYCGLSGFHGFAAYATQKPEIYVPMAVIYFLLAFVSKH
ncbi:MAG: hypothetical protein AAF689_04500 [Pseudomonadota bacterium]